MRRIVAAARALAIAAAMTSVGANAACSRCSGAPSPGATQGDGGGGAIGPLTSEQAAHVLARVGERTITLGDFEAALEHMDQFDRMRYQAPERRKELLGEMIDIMLLADEARDKGYDRDPVTQQEIREILRDAILKRAREGAPAPNEIPAEDVRKYYDAHRADFRDAERRRVSVIVLTTEAAAQSALDAARKASPTQWGELVRGRSVDATAKADTPLDLAGDLGFVSPPGDVRGANPRVPDAVRAAAFGADAIGEVVPRVVRAGANLYVVKLTAKVDPHDRTYEEAERPIRVKLAQDEIRARESALLEELKLKFPVQIDEAALAQVTVQLAVDAGSDAH